MKNLLLCTCLSFGLFTTVGAQASILLEPYLGFQTGTYKSTGGSDSTTFSGVEYGARLGYEMLGFMGGIDYATGSLSGKFSGDSSSTTLAPSDLGVFVGFEFPIMLRAYGEYIVSSSSKFTNGGSDTAKGSGFKLGVGFKFIPLFSLNLEYTNHTYTKDDNGALSPSTTDSMIGLTASVPFEF